MVGTVQDHSGPSKKLGNIANGSRSTPEPGIPSASTGDLQNRTTWKTRNFPKYLENETIQNNQYSFCKE
jgi:hypothetical protein